LLVVRSEITLALRFDSVEAYGRTMAAISADPGFMEFQAKRLKAGQADWVRANIAVQVEV
jgi:hypothetical protein